MTRRPSYIGGLDGLRGIAVLAVVCTHAFRTSGFIGVDVFFVISGYLITKILMSDAAKAGHVDFRRFYVRRVRRIIPALWTFLLIVSTVFIVFPAGYSAADVLVGAQIAAAFLTQWQIGFGDNPGPFIHLWSLGWEETFYLVWPALVALSLRTRRGIRNAGYLAVILALVIAVSRSLAAAGVVALPALYVSQVNWRVDAIFIGCALAVLTSGELVVGRRRLRMIVSYVALAIIVALTLPPMKYVDLYYLVLCQVVSAATAILVYTLSTTDGPPLIPVLESVPLRWTGEISYGLYLWHVPVVLFSNNYLKLTGVTRVVFIFGMSYLLAATSYYTVEKFFRKRKHSALDPSAIVPPVRIHETPVS